MFLSFPNTNSVLPRFLPPTEQAISKNDGGPQTFGHYIWTTLIQNVENNFIERTWVIKWLSGEM